MSSEQTGTMQDSKRDGQGRFGVGNAGGPGNPHARRVAELRSAMLAEVKPEDLAAIMRTLLELAKEGNLQAAKLVLSYTLGKPEPLAQVESAESPMGGGVGRPAPSAAPALSAAVAQGLPESLGLDVKELLKGAPSPNGFVDDLREMRLITPAAGKDGAERKKEGRKG